MNLKIVRGCMGHANHSYHRAQLLNAIKAGSYSHLTKLYQRARFPSPVQPARYSHLTKLYQRASFHSATSMDEEVCTPCTIDWHVTTTSIRNVHALQTLEEQARLPEYDPASTPKMREIQVRNGCTCMYS